MAAKVKWGLQDASEPDSSESGFYSGPMPPVQPYRVNLKHLQIKLDKNGNGRVSGPAEIAEPAKSKASKYNGYTIWVGQSFTDHPRSKAYMLSLCEAIGVDWDDLMEKTLTEEKPNAETATKVTKIGRKKIEDLELIVLTKAGRDQNNEPRLEITQFKDKDWDPDDDEDDDADDVEDDDDDADDGLDIDEDDEDDEDDSDDSDDDDADDDEEEDEEDDDDDEEEPEPAPKSRKSAARKSPTPSRKSTPAKKSSKPARKRSRRDDDEDGEPPF